MLLNKINYPTDLKKLSLEELSILAQEIRQYLISTIATTGGHLGSNLGVVELTLALHYVFNAPHDKLVWDIGHQSYVHKILTGRKEEFKKLRKSGGLCGFTNIKESIYDHFGAGHSSTSISAAAGIATALRFKGQSEAKVLPIIGDASIVSGMAFEALNHVGSLKLSNFTVILNDNNKSILESVGAFSTHLSKLTSSYSYARVREKSKAIVNNLPFGMGRVLSNLEKYARHFSYNNFFDDLGFFYIGPVDGHSLKDLVTILDNIKRNNTQTKPTLLHVVTKKGKGFLPAEEAFDNCHGIGTFKISEDGTLQLPQNSSNDYTKIFADDFLKMALQDEKIVAINAGTVSGVGLLDYSCTIPERLFDVGIAEEHAVTFAAGLAIEGYKPYVCLYSTFAQRAYDQIVHDVALQALPVSFILDRAGFVGADGATHHGLLNFSSYLPLPNIVYMVPFTSEDLQEMLRYTKHLKEPNFIHFPKAEALSRSEVENIVSYLPKEARENITASHELVFGKAQLLQRGDSGVAILAIGEVVRDSLEAAKEIYNTTGKIITVINLRFAKPLDTTLLIELSNTHKEIFVVEEGYGGALYSSISNHLAHVTFAANTKDLLGTSGGDLTLHSVCVKEQYYEHASREEQKMSSGLSASYLVGRIASVLH